MNCQSFENLIDDVARGRLMDAALREDALAHTRDCAGCSARLEDERALTAGLVAVAARDASADAPSRVESALLAAFRERHAAMPEPQEAPARLAPRAGAKRRSAAANVWWMPRWAQGAAVAAASMLLVFGLYALVRNPAPSGDLASNDGQAAPQPESARPEAVAPQQTASSADNATASTNAPEEADRNSIESINAPRGLGRTAPRQGYHLARASYGGRRPRPAPAASDAGSEITTEYIPLMNGGRLTPGDAGHVVRVELPRTALASFGLPVNADRADARVKADVLMGEDGMARAIRFVR